EPGPAISRLTSALITKTSRGENVVTVMSSLHRLAACAVALCCLASPRAFGLASEHPNDEPVSHPDSWPAPLLQIVNDTPRVGGYFVNQDDIFAFQGDATVFQ